MPEFNLSKRRFLRAIPAAAIVPNIPGLPREAFSAQYQRPNVVLICADDLGPGDPVFTDSNSISRHITGAKNYDYVRAGGGTIVSMPNLNRMAQEGARITQFNAASPVCSPSRAALLTGRYPVRVGVTDVLFPGAGTGLPDSEITIARMLKSSGYKTMCVGKWHLGSLPQYLPTNHGFDEFFGLPYSHDMSPLPLMRNLDTIESPANLATLTPRYTDEAVRFIGRSKGSPFFLYLAHFLPHIPLISSEAFRGKSPLGPYGDALAEIDWSIGQILDALSAHGLDQNTLVIFTSDHGPWYMGSSGNLRGRKGETFEGGVRVPFIARFPGQIPKSLVNQGAASNMDILPTIARICGASLPQTHLDGIDIWPLLTGGSEDTTREALLYFDCSHLQCARMGAWKLHVARYNTVVYGPVPACGRLNLPLPKPELYNLEADPGERYDLADANPQIVAEILHRIEALLPTFPEHVRTSWNNTMRLKVQDTPVGALPEIKSP